MFQNLHILKDHNLKINVISNNKNFYFKIYFNNFVHFQKFHAEKEDSYQKLLSHREKVKEDKYLLEKHENEHQRLISLIEKNKPVE